MIQKDERRKYASDLSESQWAIIELLFPRARNRSKWEKRELVDTVLSFVENGCKWRNLLHDFPPYTTVSNFYHAAIRSGLWEKICAALVELVRTEAGRNADPSYAIIDSQSVKTTSSGERGSTEEKTKGRKRHIVVDTMGNLLAVVVYAANRHDTKPGIWAAKEAVKRYPSIRRFCADAGYRKTFEQDVSRELGLGIDISVRIKPEWEVPPKRWIVERSLAWFNNSRRLSKDYERSVHSSQDLCLVAAFPTLLTRF